MRKSLALHRLHSVTSLSGILTAEDAVLLSAPLCCLSFDKDANSLRKREQQGEGVKVRIPMFK